MDRTLSFQLQGNTYSISFPTVGQFIDIESMRTSLSRGQYTKMVPDTRVSTVFALDLIDAIAHLNVLCPQILADLKTASLTSIDAVDALEIVDVYRSIIAPWISQWQEKIIKYYNGTSR